MGEVSDVLGLLGGGETSHVGAAPDSKEGVSDNRV